MNSTIFAGEIAMFRWFHKRSPHLVGHAGNVQQLCTSRAAFAAVCGETSSVVTWGDARFGLLAGSF
jgi:hypothetical protein